MSAAEKRITRFPGSTPSVPGKRLAEDDTNMQTRISPSKLPRISSFQERPQPPALIKLKVNTDSQQYSARTRYQKTSKGPRWKDGSPWSNYYAVMNEDHAGDVIIAYENTIHHQIVVIKEYRYDNKTESKQLSCGHSNIVELKEAFRTQSVFFFVYEWIDVSIAEVQSAPCGKFASYQIAAICKEVLEAINYIHEELQIAYGRLSADNVWLSRLGNVKIANIGPSIVESQAATTENKRGDLKDIGLLMVRLMELGTSLKHPDTLQLKSPEQWDQEIISFLRATETASIGELRKDVFLQKSPDSHCLKPLVFITERSISRVWSICMQTQS